MQIAHQPQRFAMILLYFVGHVAKAGVTHSKLSECAVARRFHDGPRGCCAHAICMRLVVGFGNRLRDASALD